MHTNYNMEKIILKKKEENNISSLNLEGTMDQYLFSIKYQTYG